MNILNHLKIPKYALLEFLTEQKEDEKEVRKLKYKKKDIVLAHIVKKFSKEFYKKPLEDFKLYSNNSASRLNFEKALNLTKFTKKEIEEFKYNESDFDDPFTGKKNKEGIVLNLQEHQKKFLMGFLIGNLRCSIMFHGVGTGKTLTAVATAKMYLQLYPKNKIYVVTPSAVFMNFIKEMVAYGVEPRDPRYTYLTYDKFYNNKRINCSDGLLIIDEAHNFRTEIIISTHKDKSGNQVSNVMTNKKGYDLLKRGGEMAHKVLLLTATPFVNKLYDIENLLAIGEGRDPLPENTFGDICSDADLRYDYFKYRVSHYEKNIGSLDFPERREKYICLVCPNSEKGNIRAVAGKENPFYIKTRQQSVKLDGLKAEYVLNDILLSHNKKFVVYTTFFTTGYKPLEELFKKNNISYAIISGSVSTIDKSKAILAYNNFDMVENSDYTGPKCQVLIITKAGAEGVNLKRTNTIYIMDGQWNEALYEQIVARAIRYKSHSRLDAKEQFVHVNKLFICYENEKEILEKVNNGKKFDVKTMLNQIIDKRDEIKKKRAKLKRDEKKAEKDQEELNRREQLLDKIIKFGDEEEDKKFSIEKLQATKKGSQERQQLLQNQQFAKNRHKYLTDDIKNILGDFPSTDFYLWLVQVNKQLVINSFIRNLDRIPSTEKSIIDLDFGKKMFNKIQDGKITGEEMMKALIKFLRPEMLNIQKFMKTTVKDDETKLKEFLDNRTNLRKIQIQKNIIKIGQEYFTPEDEALQLFKLSNFEKEIRGLNVVHILEPSAGHGALLKPIIDFMIKSSKNTLLKIDMVEFSKDNRQILNELVIKAPEVLNLEKTTDFLEFVPNKKYNFIFMNPPFHLDKRFNKKYKKDYYDYDFVKRAYAMLDIGGILVAITGTNYLKNPSIIKWYNNNDAKITQVKGAWKGENLKEASQLTNLERCHIFIRKTDDKEDIDLLKIEDFNLDTDIQKVIEF
jgi:hypothetical protein